MSLCCFFGPGDVIVASWPDCTWNNERLDGLVKVLRESKTFQASDGTSLFYRVTSGRDALRNMVGPSDTELILAVEVTHSGTKEPSDSDETTDESSPSVPSKKQLPGMPLPEAIQRLTGTLVGKDGQLTCLVVTLNSNGPVGRAANGTWFSSKVAGTLRVPSANSRVFAGCGTWKVPATF